MSKLRRVIRGVQTGGRKDGAALSISSFFHDQNRAHRKNYCYNRGEDKDD
jgi:hypothetical protein